MKTKSPFAWNILLVCLGCFLFIINSSNGMFGEGYEEKKKASEAAAQQQAAQNARERELTAPDNQGSDLQVDGSSAPARGDLSSGGPSEKTPEELQENESIRIIIRSYFKSLSQEEEDRLVNDINDELLRCKILFAEANRIYTPEYKIFGIAAEVAKKAGVPRPATVADAVAAYQAASAKFAEINAELEEYESFLRSIGDPPLTKQQRADFTTQFTSKIDALQQPPSLNAAVVSLSAAVKAAPALPPQPPQESPFERQKKETLCRLENQIAAARGELPAYQSTKNRIQQELDQHHQNVSRLEQQLITLKANNPFTFGLGLTKSSRQLQDLEIARDAAILARTRWNKATRDNLEAAKSSIATVSSRIQSLEQEHKRVAASEDPVIIEQRRQEAAAASAARLAQQRKKEIEEGKIAGLAQRKAIEAQLAAERAKTLALQPRGATLTSAHHPPSEEPKRLSLSSRSNSASSSPPSTPQGSKGDSSPEQLLAKSPGSNSEGLTSVEESNHSTPEKAFTNNVIREIERLKVEVEKIHEAVVNARQAAREAEEALLGNDVNYTMIKKFWENWERYFELAQERSQLKQHLSTFRGSEPKEAFKRSTKDTLFTQYNDASSAKFPYFENLGLTTFLTDLQNIYEHHGIHNMEDYHKKPEVKEREQPLIQQLLECQQQVALKFLQAELALVAPEEHPPILQQIEECVWQNMPGFSAEDRDKAVRAAYGKHLTNLTDHRIALQYSGAYSGSSSGPSSSWNPAANANQMLNYRGQQQAAQQNQSFNSWQNGMNSISFNNQMRINSNNYSHK